MFPHIILLSMDTEVGLNRRNALNYEYERLPITDENIIPPSFITERFDTRSPVVPSHLWSYLCILRMIIDRKMDSVVVCEDDAFLIGDLKDLIGLKKTTLCGGVIHGSVDFKDGVNPVQNFLNPGGGGAMIATSSGNYWHASGSNAIDWNAFNASGINSHKLYVMNRGASASAEHFLKIQNIDKFSKFLKDRI